MSKHTKARVRSGLEKRCFFRDPTVKMTVADSAEVINQTIEQPSQCFEAEIVLTSHEIEQCCKRDQNEQELFLASAAKRQKMEVKVKDLNPKQLQEFLTAKNKEIDQWLSTDTVRRILRDKIPEHQILRCRWVLTWKSLDSVEQAETGKTHKAKARLVILGYLDPALEQLDRDSPTLGKDSRMLALQLISSHRWTIRSFDIRTAFLRGSRQDGRILGVEPPPEMRTRMGLKTNEVCELLKGAYGLVNAPLLWYIELKSALLNLGFVMSPLDPCLFVLPRANSTKEAPAIHGILGIHVDDGIGGGDDVFDAAIQQLEHKYPFGSKRQQSFVFTGIQIDQKVNGEISLSQKNYVEDIEPIMIPRERRRQPNERITETELQNLRGLIGSLQYAASNTRPDLSCKLSLLQARITCATVSDLITANKLLEEAKRHKDVTIVVKPLSPKKVRFMSYSDAAFATREKAHSQRGCLILATTEEIDRSLQASVSPLVWNSKKISRVVSSTLASETYALSGALDTLNWIRLHWGWLNNPKLEWQKPDVVFPTLPLAFAVVDCKSLFDLLQKTSVPQCAEYRTMLEALVIRDRLKEGIKVKWVHSAAQMADSLTKDMDTHILRTFLMLGEGILHDADAILKQRADKKVRQEWLQETSQNRSMKALADTCISMALVLFDM